MEVCGVRFSTVLFMEYKTRLKVDTEKINPTEALEKIRKIEGIEIEISL